MLGASQGGGDGGDTDAAADVDDVQAGDRLRIVQDVASERLAADPGEGPERRVNVYLVQVKLGCVPEWRQLGREVQSDFRHQLGRLHDSVGADEVFELQ
jgi:hypothetical protein